MTLSLRLLFGATALAVVVQADPFALSPGYHRYARRNQGINWEPCGTDDAPRDCARFEVPLDWHDESAGKASLAVARYRATEPPKIGTLFVNPGGPGGSGVDMILGNADDVMNAAGGRYDVVSWDPRGIGMTVPRADCFATGTEENAFWEGTIPRAGLEARGNFTEKRDLDEFYAQAPEVDQLLEELGQKCLAYSPDTFQYVGSAAAVRDMLAMHDILEGPDKPVDYWGLSYGTIIGIYFVNSERHCMRSQYACLIEANLETVFPDRVGRVVLDGVVDPVYWANKPAYEMWGIKPESTDEAFTGFVSGCAAAGPTGCAIATENSTADSLRQWARDLLDAAYDYRRAAGPTAEVTNSAIRSLIYQGMYTPTGWPGLAEKLALSAEFLKNQSSVKPPTTRSLGSKTSLLQGRQAANNSQNEDPAPDYAFQAVTCADAADAGNTTTKDVFDFLVHVTRTVSQMCKLLKPSFCVVCINILPLAHAKKFENVGWSLLSPMAGNEADPVTPYISAKRVADALGNSAILLEQDDYGVSLLFRLTMELIAYSTASVLQNYFLKNELPFDDKLCGTNQVLFPGPGVTKKTLSALSASASTSGAGTDINTELEEARKRSQNLFITVIALAAALVLVFIGLLFSCVHNRKPKYNHAAYVSRGMFDKAAEEQGHTYDNPFKPTGGSKQGEYAPVQT
ncbi:hypothetical protein FRC10_003895 [Ceratobasidium sp. 414]|nr:hypothetical protein FRC10_003895 [Ceratobasidium sp. 414]